MKYIYIVALVFFCGCKEIYEPEIETHKKAIVIQGLLTNLNGEMSVKITEATPFDSVDNQIPVKTANVSVFDENGNEFKLLYNESGSYVNSEISGIPGHTYRLRVITSDGNIYESSPQDMPYAYSQTNIYASVVEKSEFIPSTFGGFIELKLNGIETYVDLQGETNDLPKCRYSMLTTVLYSYVDLDLGVPPPTVYCWTTINPHKEINITSFKYDRQSGLVAKHNLGFFDTSIYLYSNRPDATLNGFILSVKKYSLNSQAHQYYLDIRNLMQAEGKIFDPLPSQINGNMRCVSDPDKLVFGFFETSYVENLFYRYNIIPEGIFMIQKDEFPGWTPTGELVGNPPPFWYY